MAKEYDTLAQAASNDAVRRIVDRSTLEVQPYGNCSLFNGIAKGDLKLGNVATLKDGESLKVNVKE
jgi:hypothetical protein